MRTMRYNARPTTQHPPLIYHTLTDAFAFGSLLKGSRLLLCNFAHIFAQLLKNTEKADENVSSPTSLEGDTTNSKTTSPITSIVISQKTINYISSYSTFPPSYRVEFLEKRCKVIKWIERIDRTLTAEFTNKSLSDLFDRTFVWANCSEKLNCYQPKGVLSMIVRIAHRLQKRLCML